MPVLNQFQDASPDVRRAASPGLLVVSDCPEAAKAACLGRSLLDCGTMNVAGVYDCVIRTDDWTVLEVVLMPTTVSGTFAPNIQRLYHNGVEARSTTAGSNFANATAQTLSLTDLNGTNKCRIRFTIPGGGSIVFTKGPEASQTALAEFNGS